MKIMNRFNLITKNTRLLENNTQKVKIIVTNTLLLVVGLMLFFASSLQAQDTEVPRTRTFPGIENPAFPYAQPEEVGLSSEKLNRLGDEIVEWVANRDLVGGELLIIKNGKAVFHEAYGWSDRERRIPVMRNSIWSIKSMSKPFTATAILMLAEERKLSLDDPVSRYIPGFAGDERTTIRHLLSHTSGFSNDDLGDPTDAHDSLAEWVEDWASRKPTGTFGEYEYTDFGFAAAGYIVEKVTGMPIGPFIGKRIADPLGLEDTSTEFSDNPVWRTRLNPWYRWNDEAGAYHLRWTTGFQGWRFYPAAWGMFSNAMDYAGFMAMWMKKGEWDGVRLLSEATAADALREHAQDSWGGYGYGWFVDEETNADKMPSVFYHGGGDGTMAMALPEVDAMVIFLTHSRYGPHMGAIQDVWGMLEVFDHPGLGRVRAEGQDMETADLAPAERARYVGTYADRDEVPRWIAHVTDAGNVLHLRITRPGGRAAATWAHLIPLGDDRFAPGRYGEGGHLQAVHSVWRVEFDREGGRATKLRIVSRGDTLFVAQRADADRVRTEAAMRRDRISVVDILEMSLEREGIDAARDRFRVLLRFGSDSIRVNQVELNTFGYRLMGEDRIEEAIAVFEMNVEAYPESANTYDSLADAYREAGRLEDARRNYERAVELAEQQGHVNLENYRGKLKQVIQQLEDQ